MTVTITAKTASEYAASRCAVIFSSRIARSLWGGATQEHSYAEPDNFVCRANRLYSQPFERLCRCGVAAPKTCLWRFPIGRASFLGGLKTMCDRDNYNLPPEPICHVSGQPQSIA